ncbi:MAG: DUF6298 domain-containing protein [Thermoguttaceae bacterium]|nr:DUF6298 domain-containing protein [Thermoguttaceae bacterium]MDW8077905.1 DUF6298 domain-containing protein [Thermoguttaceae bacterium]
MKRRIFLAHGAAAFVAMSCRGKLASSAGVSFSTESLQAAGPLRVLPKNPRYFTADGERAVYVTGSHTWANLQDQGLSDPPPVFDFEAYLNFLGRYGHNFIRLWRWEVPRWNYGPARKGQTSFCQPHPWLRTGPGEAADGKPKFDLTRFDEGYFARLRERVLAAGKRGIYVSVMLFEGHCLQFAEEGWQFHPFHPNNNVNNLQMNWQDYYTLANQAVWELQTGYLRRVMDAVNDLDNVLYEVCNEAGPYSTQWQYQVIRFVKEEARRRGKEHPVGMTFQYRGGKNEDLFSSPADWISPNPEGGFRDDPPPNDGRKVVLNDTDHLWGEGGNPVWVWKTFTRGHHPLFMDRIMEITRKVITWAGRADQPDIPGAEQIRRAMGVTRRVAQMVQLEAMLPLPELASTGYLLAEPGRQYVTFIPEGRELDIDLRSTKSALRPTWVHPVSGEMTDGEPLPGGSWQKLPLPGPAPMVLVLRPVG